MELIVQNGGAQNETKEELDRREQLKGYVFRVLEPQRPNHEVAGRDRDGKPITVGEVERVFNHAYLIDFVKGPGTFLQFTRPREADALKLALDLFGRQAERENGPKLVLVK